MTTADEHLSNAARHWSDDTRALNRDKLRAIPVDEWPGETMGTHWDGCEAVHPECAAVKAAQASEYQVQEAIFEEAAYRANQDPRWDMLFPVPNGQYRKGQRPEAGLSAGKGYPDIALDVACRGYHGARFELKIGDNKPTPEQLDWLARLQGQGYFVAVCWGYEQTLKTIEWYLGLEELTDEMATD